MLFTHAAAPNCRLNSCRQWSSIPVNLAHDSTHGMPHRSRLPQHVLQKVLSQGAVLICAHAGMCQVIAPQRSSSARSSPVLAAISSVSILFKAFSTHSLRIQLTPAFTAPGQDPSIYMHAFPNQGMLIAVLLGAHTCASPCTGACHPGRTKIATEISKQGAQHPPAASLLPQR